jgi:hypothetical protein
LIRFHSSAFGTEVAAHHGVLGPAVGVGEQLGRRHVEPRERRDAADPVGRARRLSAILPSLRNLMSTPSLLSSVRTP